MVASFCYTHTDVDMWDAVVGNRADVDLFRSKYINAVLLLFSSPGTDSKLFSSIRVHAIAVNYKIAVLEELAQTGFTE